MFLLLVMDQDNDSGGRRNPPLLIVGLKQGRFVFSATHLDTILFLNGALNPATLVFIHTSFLCLLPWSLLPSL